MRCLSDATLREIKMATNAAADWYDSLEEAWTPEAYRHLPLPPEGMEARQNAARMRKLGSKVDAEVRRRREVKP